MRRLPNWRSSGAEEGIAGETVTVTDAVVEASPLYSAVIIPDPSESCAPETLSVALAVPPEPARVPEPSETCPWVKATVPDGVTPLVSVTVAVKYKVPLAAMLDGLATSVMLVIGTRRSYALSAPGIDKRERIHRA